MQETKRIALILLVLGFAVGVIGYGAQNLGNEKTFSDFFTDVAVMLFNIALVVLLIDEANKRDAEERRIQQIIEQMRSPNHIFALEAIRIAKDNCWLMDGTMKEAELFEARWNYPDQIGTKLHFAQFQKANFNNADLRGVALVNTNFQEANLVIAKLDDAVLIKANLQGAQMQKAKLIKVDLTEADLSGADLSGATLKAWSLEDAIFDKNTILPDGNNWHPDTDMSVYLHRLLLM